eukprot:m.86879 g.86879  ORF g.86879 m.86879 type:complete len:77 (-) comp50952_c0_seq6:172-402(-)
MHIRKQGPRCCVRDVWRAADRDWCLFSSRESPSRRQLRLCYVHVCESERRDQVRDVPDFSAAATSSYNNTTFTSKE